MLSVDVDTAPAERMLGAVSDTMGRTGYPQAMKRGGVVLSRAVDLNFKQGGRPKPFQELAPSTVRGRITLQRRSQGRLPVAGVETPLRVTDTLRKASVAATSAAEGSAYEQDGHSVQVGPDEDVLKYARRAIRGQRRGKRKVPARDPFYLPDGERDRIAGEVAVELRKIARDAGGKANA